MCDFKDRIFIHKLLLCFFVELSLANNLTINVNDIIVELYFDGVAFPTNTLPQAKNWQYADTVPLPPNVKTIAVFGHNFLNGAYLAASDSDGKVFTDKQWKFSIVFETGWMRVDFDDRHWKTVTLICLNDGLTPGITYVRSISRHAGLLWSPGFDTRNVSADVDVYFRYSVQGNVQRRNFDFYWSNGMFPGVASRCNIDTRMKCAARCGQLTMSLCAAFQYNSVLRTCCLIDAPTFIRNNFVYGLNWMIYTAISDGDPCC